MCLTEAVLLPSGETISRSVPPWRDECRRLVKVAHEKAVLRSVSRDPLEREPMACRLQLAGGMQAITRQQLQEKIETGERFALVEVLGPGDYEEAHLPHAMNIPLNEQFEETARRAIPDKSEPVVVYCASDTCDASPQAAERLEAIGYTNVMDYSNGKKDWKEAGLRLESSR